MERTAVIKASLRLCLAFFPLCSCNIKEDRSLCPVYVSVLTDDFVSKGMVAGRIAYSSAHGAFSGEDVSFEDFADGYVFPADKKGASLYVLSPSHGNVLDGRCVYMNDGTDCLPFFSYGLSFVRKGEMFVVRSEARKHFCRITLNLLLTEGKRYALTMKCGYNGIDLVDGTPLEEEHIVNAGTVADGQTKTLHLIRQGADSKITLYFKDLDGSADFDFDLASAFRSAGYDWTDVNLDDIEVTVNRMSMDISISICPWIEDGYIYSEI